LGAVFSGTNRRKPTLFSRDQFPALSASVMKSPPVFSLRGFCRTQYPHPAFSQYSPWFSPISFQNFGRQHTFASDPSTIHKLPAPKDPPQKSVESVAHCYFNYGVPFFTSRIIESQLAELEQHSIVCGPVAADAGNFPFFLLYFFLTLPISPFTTFLRPSTLSSLFSIPLLLRCC